MIFLINFKASYAYVLPADKDNTSVSSATQRLQRLVPHERRYEDESPPPEEPFPTITQNVFFFKIC